MSDEKLLILAETYLEGTYESELPPDCCVTPDITLALCKYLRRIYVDAHKQGRAEGLKIAIRLCSQENDIFSLPVLVEALESILDGKTEIPEEASSGE